MTYTPDIPQSGETLGGTRARINQNFQDIDTYFQVNHVALGITDGGKHKFLQMTEQSSAPTTGTNEAGLYMKEVDSTTQLYFRSESNGQEYQVVSIDDAKIASFGTASHGWTWLPGGLILNYGTVTSPGTSGQVTFDRAFSAAPYSLSLVSQRAGQGNESSVSNSTPPTATTFNYVAQAGLNALYWMAIGPQ